MHYLYGAHFKVFIDHKELEVSIRQEKELNMRQMRWMKFFKDCDFKFLWNPIDATIVVDALSKKTAQVYYFNGEGVTVGGEFQGSELGGGAT